MPFCFHLLFCTNIPVFISADMRFLNVSFLFVVIFVVLVFLFFNFVSVLLFCSLLFACLFVTSRALRLACLWVCLALSLDLSLVFLLLCCSIPCFHSHFFVAVWIQALVSFTTAQHRHLHLLLRVFILNSNRCPAVHNLSFFVCQCVLYGSVFWFSQDVRITSFRQSGTHSVTPCIRPSSPLPIFLCVTSCSTSPQCSSLPPIHFIPFTPPFPHHTPFLRHHAISRPKKKSP